MKKPLKWQAPEVVNIYDEISLWAAPFGRLLLENIPMKGIHKILDIGFGTGFPLVELSQRFGEKATIYGVDIWESAIQRARKKLDILEIDNITIFAESATTIPLPDQEIDLITSNLGINNFAEKDKFIQEAYRVLKPGGHICITTNPVGTFAELFDIFKQVLSEMDLPESLELLKEQIAHRGTEQSIESEFNKAGFKKVNSVNAETFMRFTDTEALFNHSLIRIGFLESWEKLVPERQRAVFFSKCISRIKEIIKIKGEFRLSIPMLYFEFIKKDD